MNTLHADTFAQHPAVYLNLNALQIGFEKSLADARDLATDAAQVLRLTAPGIMIANDRLLATDRTLHSHGTDLMLIGKV
jgi:hypothetical protein